MKTLNICAVFAAAGVFFCPATGRAVAPTTAATGVYDETTAQQNNVDFNATGNSENASTGNGASYTTTGPFNATVAAAFAAGRGGVVTFDSLASGTSSTSLNVTYAGGSKQFNMTFDSAYAISTGFQPADSAAISGSNYLGPADVNGVPSLTITLGAISGTSLGETGFSEIGLTLLSADVSPGTAHNFGNVTITAHFSDNSTANASRTIAENKGAGDTFYDFIAPGGLTITSLTISGPSGGVPDMDDFAFITNAPVPEPSTLSIFATGLVTMGILFGKRTRA